MIEGIWEAIASCGEGVINFLTTAINAVVSLFYTPGADGAFGSFTFVGTLALCGLAIGFVWTVIRFVRGLLRMR